MSSLQEELAALKLAAYDQITRDGRIGRLALDPLAPTLRSQHSAQGTRKRRTKRPTGERQRLLTQMVERGDLAWGCKQCSPVFSLSTPALGELAPHLPRTDGHKLHCACPECHHPGA